MKKFWGRWLLGLLLVCVITSQVQAGADRGLESLLGTEEPLTSDRLIPGESVSDWTAILAGRMGYTQGREDYLRGLWDYVTRKYREEGGLDTQRATAWHRIALTVTALGADPTCFGESPEGEPLDLIAEGTYNWSRTDSPGSQGLNGWIFALLTLDSRHYAVPEGAKFQREDMLRAILNAQEADGGFGLTSGRSDGDMTAMALQALAPYRDAYPEAVEKGLRFLAQAQTARGDFESWGSASAENCAQAVIALCALGLNPAQAPEFVREGGSAMDGLLLYQTEPEVFCHQLGEEADLYATAQCGLALCAARRLQEGKGSVYDFSEEETEAFAYSPSRLTPAVPAAAGAIALCAGIFLALKGRRKCTK